MNDLAVHGLLFGAIGVGIVAMASFYSEAEDPPALRTIPRRLGMFVLGCGVLALLLIVAEHTVASVR